MFATALQPIISLFSSTGSHPLALFSADTDASLTSDSLIHLLHDDSNLPVPSPPASLILPPNIDDGSPGAALDQTVLHIQSPTLPTTFIRCPRHGDYSEDLGIRNPWLHIQVRNMGREWSLEIGLVDQSGRPGVVRCSTFQVCLSSSGNLSVRYSRPCCDQDSRSLNTAT